MKSSKEFVSTITNDSSQKRQKVLNSYEAFHEEFVGCSEFVESEIEKTRMGIIQIGIEWKIL